MSTTPRRRRSRYDNEDADDGLDDDLEHPEPGADELERAEDASAVRPARRRLRLEDFPDDGDDQDDDRGADLVTLADLAAAFPPLADGDPCGRRAVASWCRRHGLPVERSRAHGRPLVVSLRELRLVRPAAHAAILAGERGRTLEELRGCFPTDARGVHPSSAAILRWLRSMDVPIDRLGTGHLVWPADLARKTVVMGNRR